MAARKSRRARPEDVDEITRDELVEVVTDAWLATAPKKLVREFLT